MEGGASVEGSGRFEVARFFGAMSTAIQKLATCDKSKKKSPFEQVTTVRPYMHKERVVHITSTATGAANSTTLINQQQCADMFWRCFTWFGTVSNMIRHVLVLLPPVS